MKSFRRKIKKASIHDLIRRLVYRIEAMPEHEAENLVGDAKRLRNQTGTLEDQASFYGKAVVEHITHLVIF